MRERPARTTLPNPRPTPTGPPVTNMHRDLGGEAGEYPAQMQEVRVSHGMIYKIHT